MKITNDVTHWMTNELHEMLTRVILAKQDYSKIYFILVIMKDGYLGPTAQRNNELINPGRGEGLETINLSKKHVLHNRLVLLPWEKLPVTPMLGTSLWRIDNKAGEARCMYILPEDKPIIFGTDMGEASKFIWKSAEAAGSPLVYSSNN